MALIPMIFKADGGDDYPKKGKVRAEDLSALFACSLSQKIGILDMLNTCTYYNVSVSGDTATISFHNGYIVIYGRLIYIEEGTSIQVPLATTGTISGKIGVRVSLSASEEAECEWFNKTTDLVQEDLTNNPVAGVYEFPIYNYSATTSTLTLTSKTTALIKENSDLIDEYKSTNANGARYATDDNGEALTGKGSIDARIDDLKARLDALGFRTGNGTNLSGVSSVALKRQGNLVICTVVITNDQISFNIPEDFRPNSEVVFSYGAGSSSYNSTSRKWEFTGGGGSAKITTAGVCTTTQSGTSNAQSGHGSLSCTVQLGWEADPIEP